MLELAEPMGRGASGSGRFRVGEKVCRGRYKSRVSGCGRVIVNIPGNHEVKELQKTAYWAPHTYYGKYKCKSTIDSTLKLTI